VSQDDVVDKDIIFRTRRCDVCTLSRCLRSREKKKSSYFADRVTWTWYKIVARKVTVGMSLSWRCLILEADSCRLNPVPNRTFNIGIACGQLACGAAGSWISLLRRINLLTPNVNYSGRTAPLTSKVAFYIFIQQIQVLNILNTVYTLRFLFLSQNAVCFIVLMYLVPVLFTFYIQGVLKLKKNNSAAKRLNYDDLPCGSY